MTLNSIKNSKHTMFSTELEEDVLEITMAKAAKKPKKEEEEDDDFEDEKPSKGKKTTSEEEEDDDVEEGDDNWNKDENEDWDADFDEFDIPKSKGGKVVKPKKGESDEDDFKIDEDFKEFDLFNDSNGFDEEDDF